MRELNLLAGNCRFFNGNGTGCLILCVFFRFSESPEPEEPIVVVLGSFGTHLLLLQIRKNH